MSLFLTNAVNIRYLTGFSGLSPLEREAYLLKTQKKWYLFTFQLYREEAESAAKKNPQIEIHYITPEHRLSSLLSSVFEKNTFQTIEFEQNSITVKEYNEIKTALPSLSLVPDKGTIETLRLKKSKKEISDLKKAIALTDDCFSFIQTLIKKGITEKELAWRIERFFREQNAQISFDPIVAFNEHSAVPHHVASSQQLSANSLILMDFGAKVEGYHADMTRVIFFGTPNDEWIKAYNTLKQAQEIALTYLSTGNSGAKADEITRKVITDKGYPVYPHSLGHGVGLEIHENPRLSVHRDHVLEEGMVFSVEPGIYLQGKFGMRIEDLVLKTKDGVEILSKSNKNLLVIQE